jgi:deazaflavin-dependent oxidoreductase (nitroreductase family)
MATNWDWFARIHRAVYERTGGRLMARLAGMDMLLLTTRGRKSGQPRTLPLACFPDGDRLVVVASNAGQDTDPAWWLNLKANPEAEVQFGRERFRVRARAAAGAERERLWPWLKQRNPMYARYEKKTARDIPVVVLERVA